MPPTTCIPGSGNHATRAAKGSNSIGSAWNRDPVHVQDSSGGNHLTCAGEPNGEGHPDFFLTRSNREACSELQLHLSQPGPLLAYRKLGGFLTCGS